MNARYRSRPGDSLRYLINLILFVILVGLLVVLAFYVGWWMMSVYHAS